MDLWGLNWIKGSGVVRLNGSEGVGFRGYKVLDTT